MRFTEIKNPLAERRKPSICMYLFILCYSHFSSFYQKINFIYCEVTFKFAELFSLSLNIAYRIFISCPLIYESEIHFLYKFVVQEARFKVAFQHILCIAEYMQLSLSCDLSRTR